MPRISLVEAYNNRDVIAWLVKHQDAIDEMMNILQNVNPDGDLTNIVLKTGDQTIDGVKTFIGKIVANCDIIQNGAAYETHAEQLFTKNDYIVMRDGALGGLQPGEFSGFRINRYDSVHDGHLVMDSSGIARVGDVGDEQPLTTRDEAADMTDGAIVTWDTANVKIKAAASNVGDDTHPVKIAGGVPTAVSKSFIQGIGKIQYGETSGGNTSQTVIFDEPFTSRPYVFLTADNSNSGLIWSTHILSISTTGFDFECKYSGLSSNLPSGYNQYLAKVQWIAIGE